MNMHAHAKAKTAYWVKVCLVIAIVVAANLLVGTFLAQVDLSHGQKYTLSPLSVSTIRNLKQPLTIRIYLSRKIPYPNNRIESQIRDLMTLYKRADKHHELHYSISYAKSNSTAKKDQAVIREALKYHVAPVQLQNLRNGEVKIGQYYMSMVLVYGNTTDVIKNLAGLGGGMEYTVTNRLIKLSDKLNSLLALPSKIQVQLLLSNITNYSALNFTLPSASKTRMTLPINISNPADFLSFVTNLGKAVQKSNDTLYQRLKFVSVDTTTLSATRIKALRSKFQFPDYRLVSGRKTAPLFFSVIVSLGKKAYAIPVGNIGQSPDGKRLTFILSDPKQIAQQVGSIVDLLLRVDQNIGFIGADVGGLSFYDSSRYGGGTGNQLKSAAKYFQTAQQNFNIRPIFHTENMSTPGFGDLMKYSSIVIAGPTQPLSDWQLFQLDQFLMRGGSLILYMPQYSQSQGTAKANKVSTGLEKMLASYGISFQNGIVYDTRSYQQVVPNQTKDGEHLLKVYYLLRLAGQNINQKARYMRYISGGYAYAVSPLKISSKAKPYTTVLTSSSDKSWLVSPGGPSGIFATSGVVPPVSNDSYKQYPLSAFYEGPLKSYFAGKATPKPPVKSDGTKAGNLASVTRSSSTKMGRFYVTGSGGAVSDFIFGQSPLNQMIGMNVLDHATGNDARAALRAKQSLFNQIKDLSDSKKSFAKIFYTTILPVIVGLLALFAWIFYTRRQQKIAMLYSEKRSSK